MLRKVVRPQLEACGLLGYQARSQLQADHSGDADVSINTSGGHAAMDYAEHQRTYAGFLYLAKITIVLIVALLAGMAFFLV